MQIKCVTIPCFEDFYFEVYFIDSIVPSVHLLCLVPVYFVSKVTLVSFHRD